jgi:branched-chain amino acid aminotransferase
MSIYYVNGQFVPAEEASLPATDLAILRGFGVFDYLRTYNGKPFRLHNNIARLRRSANIIGLDYPHTDDDITQIVHATLAKNAGLADNFAVRIVVTGGTSPDNITPSDKPSLLVMVTPLKEYPAEWYEHGVKVITVDIARVFPNAKSTNYIPAIVALRMAKAQEAVEALYLDSAGMVLEATTSNLFAFFGNTLVTPEEGILPGITRATVLELARDHYTLEVRGIHREELLKADEVFMSAANKKVMPVRQIDDTLIGDGRVGERTRHMMELFAELTHRETL